MKYASAAVGAFFVAIGAWILGDPEFAVRAVSDLAGQDVALLAILGLALYGMVLVLSPLVLGVISWAGVGWYYLGLPVPSLEAAVVAVGWIMLAVGAVLLTASVVWHFRQWSDASSREGPI